MKLNYKRIFDKIKKLNFTSIMFFVFSLVSATFAWFAFSNIVDNDVQIDIKAWKVDISEGDSLLTSKLEINLNDFYPGSDITTKEVKISNEGDISSVVSYKINYLRIFDQEFDLSNQDLLFDNLAQTYPFTINFDLDKEFLDIGDEATFSYSILWPLDSGDDNADAQWGNRSYDFLVSEQNKKNQDSTYNIRPSISIEVELMVEQFVDNGTNTVDENYVYGSYKYLNVNTLATCTIAEENCYKYNVIEKENKKSKGTVKMMAAPTQVFNLVDYSNATNVLDSMTLFNIISTDVVGTQLVRPNLSSRIVGKANDVSYYSSILQNMNETGSYILFDSSKFKIFESGDCYWISNAQYPKLAVKSLDINTLQLYFEKENLCKAVPVIDYSK